MTLNSGGTFSCQWSNINNALFRKGKKFNETQTHQQIGNISVTYGCDYQPNGNSYLCVYGWTSDPLVEYYIVDSWGSWRLPGQLLRERLQLTAVLMISMRQPGLTSLPLKVQQHSNSTGVFVLPNVQAEPFL